VQNIIDGANVVTHPAYDEPQTSVIQVNTEVLTKSTTKSLRCKTHDINRWLNESDDEIVIYPTERERNLIIEKNYQHYGELGNDTRRKVPFVISRFNRESLGVVDYDFKVAENTKCLKTIIITIMMT
jgi:hypothetical protein